MHAYVHIHVYVVRRESDKWLLFGPENSFQTPALSSLLRRMNVCECEIVRWVGRAKNIPTFASLNELCSVLDFDVIRNCSLFQLCVTEKVG